MRVPRLWRESEPRGSGQHRPRLAVDWRLPGKVPGDRRPPRWLPAALTPRKGGRTQREGRHELAFAFGHTPWRRGLSLARGWWSERGWTSAGTDFLGEGGEERGRTVGAGTEAPAPSGICGRHQRPEPRAAPGGADRARRWVT